MVNATAVRAAISLRKVRRLRVLEVPRPERRRGGESALAEYQSAHVPPQSGRAISCEEWAAPGQPISASTASRDSRACHADGIVSSGSLTLTSLAPMSSIKNPCT